MLLGVVLGTLILKAVCGCCEIINLRWQELLLVCQLWDGFFTAAE